MKVDIVTAALPPQLDGIGDHTARLAANLATHAEVRVLVGSRETHLPVSGCSVIQAFDAHSARTVSNLLPAVLVRKPDWVFLQYNPFSYGRWGWNPYLVSVFRQIRRTSPGTRIALMAHETFVPFINPKFAIMTTWQRMQLWCLGREADIIFSSIEKWATLLRGWFPRKKVEHLPVGSNIEDVGADQKTARRLLGIHPDASVIGVFGTAHPSRLIDWVATAAVGLSSEIKNLILLYIGPDGIAVREAARGACLLDRGPLPQHEVSEAFAAMDVHLAPFIDGVSTRRGSMMVGLQHGIATVGTNGFNTDAVLRDHAGKAIMLADSADRDGFVALVRLMLETPAKRQVVGAAGRQLYNREFAWDRAVARLLDAFGEK